ncbi:unnamed protein product [Oikopleura dioica]|uniref:Uncharacterized protein n=1 Tax=Oikopleura dioica TaxID=34765 RepID=E4XAQ5_OIKDI|nr:unnamed protein product [Oikopleura dioica]
MTITDGVYEDYISGSNSFAKKFIPNIFTEEGDKIETIGTKDISKKNSKEEFWWSFSINAFILTTIGLMIFIFNIRELEPYVEQIPSAPHHTIFLKCAMNLDRSYMNELWNSTEDIPLSSQSEYTQNLLLESSTVSQLIRNLTCEYLPDHKAMT